MNVSKTDAAIIVLAAAAQDTASSKSLPILFWSFAGVAGTALAGMGACIVALCN